MKLIGKGNTAEVFDLGNGKIVKLFVPGYPKEPVLREYNNAKIIQSFGIPVPECYDFVEMDGRYGITYELFEGTDLFNHLVQNNAGEKDLVLFCNLQKQILDNRCDDLMSYKDFIRLIIQDKSPETLEKLNKLPDDNCVCHGDFHLFNIMINEEGTAKVIDFMNVCKGPRLYDIARTYYLMRGDPKDDDSAKTEEERQMLKGKIAMMDIYLQILGVTKEELTPYFDVISICHQIEML